MLAPGESARFSLQKGLWATVDFKICMASNMAVLYGRNLFLGFTDLPFKAHGGVGLINGNLLTTELNPIVEPDGVVGLIDGNCPAKLPKNEVPGATKLL